MLSPVRQRRAVVKPHRISPLKASYAWAGNATEKSHRLFFEGGGEKMILHSPFCCPKLGSCQYCQYWETALLGHSYIAIHTDGLLTWDNGTDDKCWNHFGTFKYNSLKGFLHADWLARWNIIVHSWKSRNRWDSTIRSKRIQDFQTILTAGRISRGLSIYIYIYI